MKKYSNKDMQLMLYRFLQVTYDYYKNALESTASSYVLVPFSDYVEIIFKKSKKGDYKL